MSRHLLTGLERPTKLDVAGSNPVARSGRSRPPLVSLPEPTSGNFSRKTGSGGRPCGVLPLL